jgi:hypothetical protein
MESTIKGVVQVVSIISIAMSTRRIIRIARRRAARKRQEQTQVRIDQILPGLLEGWSSRADEEFRTLVMEMREKRTNRTAEDEAEPDQI